MPRSNSLRFTLALAATALISAACGDNDTLSPEIISCADSELAILVADLYYQACETTDLQPGPGSIGSADLTVTGDDEADVFALPFTFDFYGTDYTEVGVSTNGLVWLGDNDSTSYDIDLIANGDPVIAAWNADLDSDSHGRGVRVQAFEAPNRVLVDFHTETHENVGEDWLNRFQVVIYESGEIVFHYFYFNNSQDCYDDGSGISEGTDDEYIDLSDALGGNVCDVADQRSFMFEPLPPM